MASWAEFEAAEAEFASRVRQLLSTRKHLTMATLRSDGSPRISGTEVEFADGQVRLGSMPGAVKALVQRSIRRRTTPRDGRARRRSPASRTRSIQAAMLTGS